MANDYTNPNGSIDTTRNADGSSKNPARTAPVQPVTTNADGSTTDAKGTIRNADGATRSG